jgi:hypothetical protein
MTAGTQGRWGLSSNEVMEPQRSWNNYGLLSRWAHLVRVGCEPDELRILSCDASPGLHHFALWLALIRAVHCTGTGNHHALTWTP